MPHIVKNQPAIPHRPTCLITSPFQIISAISLRYAPTANYLSDYYVYYVVPLDSDFGVAWTTAVFNTKTFGFACVG